MYHRYAVSKRIFHAVDDRIFRKLMRWCHRRHPEKSGKWIKERYFQREGHRDWVFTGTIRDSTGSTRPIRLMPAAGVKVLRWKKIRSAANPYDPGWELYLEERSVWKLTHTLAGRGRIEYLWKEQEGRCVMCGQILRPKSSPGTSTIGSGAVEAAVRHATTWSCCTPTVIDKSIRTRDR